MQRFLELMGRPPAYVHHHSLITQVLHEVVDEFGLHPIDLHRRLVAPLLDIPWYTAEFGPSSRPPPTPSRRSRRCCPRSWRTTSASWSCILVVHPGYVDAELLDITTYNIIRGRDLQLVTDAGVRALLADAGVELTTYSAMRAGG